MVIETFILCVDEGSPKDGINVIILHGGAVFIEIFAEQHSVSRV